MKKIFTLSSALLITLISFADYAPSRLSVSAQGNANVKITIDEGRGYSKQSAFGDAVFENLMPGFHTVKVYQLVTGRGFFGKKREEYRLMYSTTVNIKPMYATAITVNRNGKGFISEQPIRGKFGNGRDDDWKRNDHDNKPGRGDYRRQF